jgi:hypothetical protein
MIMKYTVCVACDEIIAVGLQCFTFTVRLVNSCGVDYNRVNTKVL